jgi:hypothetical protein
MAYVEGYPGGKTRDVAAKHIGLIAIVAVTVAGLMIYFSDDWKAELPSIVTVTAIILALVAFVSSKVNPAGWKSIFRRSALERELKHDRMIADSLALLDDSHFIFHDITFELFRIENLVISPRGVFVIGKIAHGENLHVKNNVLFAGDSPLDKTTGDIWRVCHLVNIVIKKGFQTEVMPKPILVSPGANSPAVAHYDGITIIPLRKLNETVERQEGQAIKEELVHSFAFYMKKRYA